MEDPKLDQENFLVDELIQIVDTLRGEKGCPWDKKQTPQTVILYLIEEAYELADAIETENPDEIREELGDVLFHIFFIAEMFRERERIRPSGCCPDDRRENDSPPSPCFWQK